MASRKEETQSRPAGHPGLSPHPPLASTGELLSRWRAEVAELRQRLTDAEQIIHDTQTKLHASKEKLRATLAAQAKAQEDLRDAQRRTSEVLASITDGYFVLDAQWRFLELNTVATHQVFKRPAEELVGKVIWEVFPNVVEHELRRQYHLAATQNHPVLVEACSHISNKWWELRAYLRKGRIEVYLRDITARKEAEDNVRDRERRFRLMGEAVPYGIWMCNPAGRLEYVSQSFLDLLEMTMDQVHDFGWTRRMPFEDVEPTMRKWANCLRAGEDWESEYRIMGPDGQYHTILARGKPVRDERGEITSWVGIHLDITARKRIETTLAEHVRELNRSNAELEQFASVVSHDLRAPLTSIGGCAHLLAESLSDRTDADTVELLANIQDSIKHMGRLIKSLLAYSRVGKGGLKLTDCDTQATLGAVLVDLRAAITTAGAHVTHNVLPVVRADEGLLAQLLQNLIENAIKYRGQAAPIVHIRAPADNDHWVFSVQDNGIGIDPQHFERIFLIFERLHGDESLYPGLGVGLATCKKIVEQHRGRIWVDSTPGAGSVFHFSLPRG